MTLPPSGTVARVATARRVVDTITLDGTDIPVDEVTYGEIVGLPAPEPDTTYVVSILVATAAAGRDDLLVVGDAVRDEAGRVIGCRGLSRPGRGA